MASECNLTMPTLEQIEMSANDAIEMSTECNKLTMPTLDQLEICIDDPYESSTDIHKEMLTKDNDRISTESEPTTKDKQIASTKDSVVRSSKKGIVIHSEERGIIRNVLRFCEREANINALLYPLKKAQQRAAAATRVSARTIARIRKEARSNLSESKVRSPEKRRRKRKAIQEGEDKPNSSNNEKPEKSDTSSDDEEKTGSDFTTESADEFSDSGGDKEGVSNVNPKWPATDEYVFKEVQTVDINFFVRCLRKANTHHDTLRCNLSDLFMYEEASKNGILGIIFRCRVCLMAIIVWTQDPNAKVSTPQPEEHTTNVPKKKTKLSSSPIPIDLISPKMRNLPEFLDMDKSFKSNPPLIGWPQVATVDENSASTSSGLNPPSESVQPTATNATVAEKSVSVNHPNSSPEASVSVQSSATVAGKSFSVDHPNSPPEASVSAQSSDHSTKSTSLPNIYASSASYLKAKHLARLKKKAAKYAKLAYKKSLISSTLLLQRRLRPRIAQSSGIRALPLQPRIDQFSGIGTSPLQPRIGQSIGLRVSSLQPGIVTSNHITSSFQPKLVQSNAIIASTLQPALNQSSGIMLSALHARLMTSTIQPRFDPSSGIISSTLQPRFNQSSGIMTSTLQPRFNQSSGIMTSSLQPRFNPSSGIMTASLQSRFNQLRGIMTSNLQPRLNLSSGIIPSTIRPRRMAATIRPRPPNFSGGIIASTSQPRLMQTSGMMTSPLQPRIIQTSDVRTSPTVMLNSSRLLIIQRPLTPQGGLVTSSAYPEQIMQTVQRPLQPMFVQSSGPSTTMPGQIFLTPSAPVQRPLTIASSGSLRISPTPQSIVTGQDLYVQRPLMQPRITGSVPERLLFYHNRNAQRPLVPKPRHVQPEKITVTPDVFPHRISSGNDSLSDSGSAVAAPEIIISDVVSTHDESGSAEAEPVDLNIVKMEFEEAVEDRDTTGK